MVLLWRQSLYGAALNYAHNDLDVISFSVITKKGYFLNVVTLFRVSFSITFMHECVGVMLILVNAVTTKCHLKLVNTKLCF